MAEDQNKFIASNDEACRIITKEMISEVVRKDKGSDAILKSFNVIDFTTKGDNYSCYVTCVEAEYMIEGKISSAKYVAKMNSKRGFSVGEAFTASQFKQENMFYAELLPELNEILHANHQESLRIPKFYHFSDKAGSEIMFFEDMRQRGFKLFDRLKSVDELHAELVFKELGRLHAAGKLLIESYGEQEANAKFKIFEDTWSLDESKEMMGNFFSATMVTGSKLAENLGQKYHRAAQVLLDLSPDVKKTMDKLFVPKQPFATILHGDCWSNNILYRYENGKPVEVCLLDLQMVRYSSVGIDLNYFLFTSFNGPVRRNNLDIFLETYLNAYKSCLPPNKTCGFTLQELRTEFEKNKMYGLVMSLIILPLIVSTGDEVPDFNDVTDENMAEKTEEYNKDRLTLMKKHPIFQPRFKDIIDDMIAAGILV